MIEQKSFGINLDEKYPQSDGAILTPFEQAQRYVEGYNSKNSYEDRIKWVVVCNFSTFRIYDFRYENNLFFEMYPEFQLVKEFKLLQLYNNIEYLKFLVDPNDDAVKYEATLSKKSADIVSEIKEIFEPNYHEDEKEFLNKLCTRLVFLYYANDAKLIDNNLLMKYFENRKYTRDTLINLFAVLNQKENLRDENISDDLKSFPYVNGGLFAEDIYIPNFDSNADKKIRNVIKNAHKDSKIKNFAWKYINPTIFGSLFENILDDDERHTGGMHYTSPENIHKVIDPLFLDDLKLELKEICDIAFQELDIIRITGRVIDGNDASIRVLEKNQFEFENASAIDQSRCRVLCDLRRGQSFVEQFFKSLFARSDCLRERKSKLRVSFGSETRKSFYGT